MANGSSGAELAITVLHPIYAGGIIDLLKT